MNAPGNPAGAQWAEPLLVRPDDGVACSAPSCCVPARWTVEPMGWTGDGQVPDDAPVRTACDEHLALTLEAFA